jgi:hypothetical protein
VSWLNDVSARKERAAVDKIGVSKERDFHNIPATLKQAEYIERHVSGQISPFPTLDLAKYAFAEHDGHIRLIPVTNGR